MAGHNAYLLELGGNHWRLHGPASREDGAEVDTVFFEKGLSAGQAEPVAEALRAAGWEGEPVVVALAAECVLHATVDIPTPQVVRKPQMLRYHFEAFVPWPAEEFVAACVPHDARALVFAVRHEPIAELLAALASLEITVAAVVPLSLLALQGRLEGAELGDGLVTWQRGDAVDLWRIEGRRPIAWTRLRACSEDVRRGLVAEALIRGEAHLVAIDTDEALLGGLPESEPVRTLTPEGQVEAAVHAAGQIVAGKSEPLVDLLADELITGVAFNPVRREARRLVAAALLSALVVGAALWRQADRLTVAAEEMGDETVFVYAELFPDQEPPARPLPHLKKERARLRGTRNVDRSLPERAAADRTLQDFLAGLPEKMRFRLLEVRVEGEKVYAAGEVRSNDDADRLVESIRRQGFAVDAPRTQRLAEKGFGLRLSAAVQEQATAERKEGDRRR